MSLDYQITPDLKQLSVLDPELLLVVGESPLYVGELVFQTFDEQGFLRRYSNWVSRLLCLSNLFNLPAFLGVLKEDGWQVVFSPTAEPILAQFNQWDQPIEIPGFELPRGGELYPFQYFTLRRALARSGAQKPQDRLFYVGWCAGAGKSIVGVAGARHLYSHGDITRTLVFTTNLNKVNLARMFARVGDFEVGVPDGSPRQRGKVYDEFLPVYVMNFEKARFDMEQIRHLVADQRVLVVVDECQHILSEEGSTKTRRCFDDLMASTDPIIWPMSASVVGTSPFRYRDLFALAGGPRVNPLGTKKDFELRYAESVTEVEIPVPGRRYPLLKKYYKWDHQKLAEVRHRIADRAQQVRKTDPGVAEYFKDMRLQIMPVQMDTHQQRLYEILVDWAADAKRAGKNRNPYYELCRHVCNTPESLAFSNSPIAAELIERYPGLVQSASSAKFDVFIEKVQEMAEAGDKVVAFTQWTEMCLLRLSPLLDERGIRHVIHYGKGQANRDSQAAQDRFKADESITLFLSSDAGKEGLNFQEARYVINIEPDYLWDTVMQRSERINRADSYLEGLTSFILVTEDSVEERVYEVMEQRRQLAEATLGTDEVLSLAHKSELENVDYLIFGT